MANPAHLEILSRGVKHWNQWRTERPDVAPDISLADLQGRDLERIDLSNTNANATDFYNSNLRYSVLNNCIIDGAKLIQADMSACSLDGTSARYAHFVGARFSMSTISRTNFTGSRFDGSFFQFAQIANCNMSGIHIADASMNASNVSHVSFRGSKLRRLGITRSFVSDVGVGEATLDRLSLDDCSINKVTGIDTARCTGQTTVDFQTFVNSGSIDLDIIRSMGYNDWQREMFRLYDRSLAPSQINDCLYEIFHMISRSPIEMFSCFISYSHDDKSFANMLYRDLVDAGVRCWLDEHQMLPGDDLYEQVDRGIKMWDKTILCCSQNSLTSWWVDNEIDSSFEKERLLMKQRGSKTNALIPVDIDGFIYSDEYISGKKRQLLSRFVADFREYETEKRKYDLQLKKLLRALSTDGGGREPAPKPKI